MRIGGEDIATPQDSPYAYDTAWRHNVARAAKLGAGGSDIMAFKDDDMFGYFNYLKLLDNDIMADCLDQLSREDARTHGPFVSMSRAHSIYQGMRGGGAYDTTKEKIEALLLCPEMTYDAIARYFNVDGDTVRVFERLYYNVRDEDGLLLGGKGVLETCACISSIGTGDPESLVKDARHWRLLAFEGGHKSLLYEWRWHGKDFNPVTDIDTTAELIRQCYRKFSWILRSGQNVDQRALAAMISGLNERLAHLQERGILSAKEVIDKDVLIVQLLGVTAPSRNLLSEKALNGKAKELENKLGKPTRALGEGKKDTSSIEYINSQMTKKI